MMYLTDHRSQVLAKLRALISSSLQLIYQLRFNHDPPLCLYRVRDLTFLPHLLESGKPSRQITVAELAQKILLTTDANTEEVLNQSIERLDNETHYDQQRQLLQRHLKGTADTSRAPSAPKPSDAHQHKPPKGSHEVRSATPNRADPDNKAYPVPSTPQRTSGAPSIDGQPPKYSIHNCSSEPLALGAAPIGAYPNAVATQPASTPELAGGAPPIGGQPPAAYTHTPAHTPNTPQPPSNSSPNSSPTSPTSCSTFAVTTRANNHPVSDTSPLGMLEDGRDLGALVTTNSKRSRPTQRTYCPARDPLDTRAGHQAPYAHSWHTRRLHCRHT